jgi:hypothetical protein
MINEIHSAFGLGMTVFVIPSEARESQNEMI